MLTLLALTISLSVTYLLWKNERHNAEQELRAEFDFRVRDASSHIEQRMQAYEEVLRGVAGLMSHSGDITRKEFRNYFDRLRLEQNYSGIQGLAYQPILPLAKLDRHIATVRKEGFPEYTVRPEGRRELLTPVVYIEPFSGRNLRAFGYDTHSESKRRAAMESACDRNEAVISRKVRLEQETGQSEQAGFVMYLPIYKNGAPHDTLTERRANITGWVSAPFRVGDLMSEVLRDHSDLLDFEIYDGEEMSEQSRLYDSDDNPGSRLGAYFQSVRQIPVAGLVWTVAARSHAGFEGQLDDRKSRLIAYSGISISLLLALLTWSLASSRARALKAAHEMTRELSESKARYQQMFDQAAPIAFLIDPDNGRIVDANASAVAFWGYTLDELRGMNISQINTATPEEIRAAMEKVKGNALHHLEWRHRLKSGEIRDVEVYISPLVHQGRTLLYSILHDITERKRLEDRLAESEKKFHSIFESVGDCIEIISMDGRILDMNQTGYERQGYMREEMVGRKLSEITAPEFSGKVVDRMALIKAQGYATFESGRLHKDGSVVPLEVRSRLIEIGGQQVFLGISRDISERKQAERALRQALEFTEGVVNAIPDLLFELDREGRYRNIWAHDPHLLAAQKEMLLGHTVNEMLPPDAAGIVMSAIAEADEKGESRGQVIHLSLPQGESWFELSTVAKPAADGASRHFIMLSRDVSERMRAEDALRASEEKLRGLYELSPMGIALTDIQGHYLEFNDAFREICGYTREELNQLDYWALTPKEYADKEAEQLESLNTKGYYGPYEKEYIRKDGSRIPLRLNGVLIRDQEGKSYIWSIVEDITARKHAETALRENEERLALATLHNGVGIWDWNLVTQEMIWDDSMYALYRIRREDFIGTEEAWRASLHPDDLERGDAEVGAAIRGEKPFDTEFRVVWPNGEIRHIKAVAKVFRDEQGTPLRMLGTNVDITERKQAEEMLRKLSAAVEQSGASVVITDLDARIQYVNPRFTENTGYSAAEAIGQNPRILQSGQTPRETYDALWARLTGGQEWQGELLNKRKNGELYWEEVSIAPIKNQQDVITHYVAVKTEITERKRMEDALREQKEFLASIFENALDAVMLMDSKGAITGWSKQAEQIFGWSHDEAIGRLMHETIIPAPYREQHLRGMRHFLATGEGPALNTRIEISALHRDGHEFPVELSISPIKTEHGYEFSSFIRDISERKRLAQQLTESEATFRAIFEQAANGVELIDPVSLRFVEANPAACRMLGYTHEEYLQLRLSDTQAALQGDALIAAVRQIEETGGATFENRHRCKNGDILDVEVTARMLNVPGKRVLVGVWRDITESKRAEAALRTSENKYRELFEAAGDGIFIQDANGFIDCNEKGASLYGLTRAEVIGRHPSSLAPERQPNGQLSSEFAAEEIRAALGGKPQQFEWRALRADGTPLDAEITLSRIEFGDAVCLQAVVRDITERKLAEMKLQQSEAHFRFITESAQALIWMSGTDKLCIWFNKVWLDFTGRTMEQELGEGWVEDVHPDDIQRCIEIYASHFDRREPFSMEYRLRRYDGEYRWIVDNGAPRFNAQGDFEGYIGSCFDITDRRMDEEKLRITASVFDTTQEAILITDSNNIITDINPAFTRITGYSRDEVLGRNPKFLSSGRHDRNFYAVMWQAIIEKKSWRGEIWNRRKTGETYAELLSVSAICGPDGKVQRHVGVFSDISYLKEHEAELSRVAHYDALTGIPNRVLLADRMKQAIAQTSREQDMMAVCYLDLDGFKPVNDSLGHEAGDQVLIEIARRIGNTIRGGDTVARLGGDEFVVLLLGLERGDECMTTLERLLNVIAQPMEIKGKSIMLGASIGVSIYPLDDEDSDTLLRHADQAMYISKQSGKNRYHIYDPALDLRARNHYEFIRSIREGIAQNQFELHYQPKINLKTGDCVGAEALIRWRHTERGLLLPADFLPAIESSELGIEIGEWVIAEALNQLDRWRQAGLDTEVSINISAHHLETPSFVETLQQHLARHPAVAPRQLQIEVLETAALKDIVIVRNLIESCRHLGVRFALDDFGTGYSSLSYLSSLPVDVLKIDQSFVRDMLDDAGDCAIVQGVIALARAFGRETVAEGIETDAQLRALLEMGCEIGQGYGIARPMPADQLFKWRKCP